MTVLPVTDALGAESVDESDAATAAALSTLLKSEDALAAEADAEAGARVEGVARVVMVVREEPAGMGTGTGMMTGPEGEEEVLRRVVRVRMEAVAVRVVRVVGGDAVGGVGVSGVDWEKGRGRRTGCGVVG